MMLVGIVLRSVADDTPLAEDSFTHRTPSTNTSTRFAPRCRRSTVAAPAPTPPWSGGKPVLPLVLNLMLRPPPELVIRCNTSPTEVVPDFAISASLTVVSGAGWLRG